MAKVRSFKLRRNNRVGNYRVIEKIGRGWEGEVYKVEEVPTASVRALKLFRTGELSSIRHLIHFAWYYEQLRSTGHVPIYYHWGQWFLDDDNGCWFLVFEFVPGKPLAEHSPSEAEAEALFRQLATAMARIHCCGYAVGDIATLRNVIVREPEDELDDATEDEPCKEIVREPDNSIVFVDCYPGCPDDPNINFETDCKKELPAAAKKLFKDAPPPRVARLLEQLEKIEVVTKSTLAEHLMNYED